MMAAELALGLLDGEERAVALRRVLSDRGFAAEVEWWRRHLADLLDDYPSVPAPEGLIDRIAMASRPKPRSRLKTLIPAGLAVAAAVLLVLFLRPVPVATFVALKSHCFKVPLPRPGLSRGCTSSTPR